MLGKNMVSGLGARAAFLLATVTLSGAVVHAVLSGAPGAEQQMPSYTQWLWAALGGDLGRSSQIRIGEEVTVLLAKSAGQSLRIILASLVFAMLGAAALTAIWTSRARPALRTLSRGLVYVLSASPVFLLAYWTLVGVNNGVASAIKEGWMQRPLWFPVPIDEGLARYVLAAVVLSTGSGTLMETARGLTHEVERLMRAEFILFARARGRPLIKHLGPALIGPVAGLTVNRLTSIFSGALVVEVIFNVPGLGRLTWDAALARDTRVLMGATLTWAVCFASARLIADLVQVASDPKRRSARWG